MENLENNESVNIIEQLERIRTATILASKTVYNTAEACEYMGISAARAESSSTSSAKTSTTGCCTTRCRHVTPPLHQPE